MFFTSRDDTLLYFLILLYFILTFYPCFIVKPHEAQTFQCRGQLLLVNLLKHMLWCYGHFFVFSSEMENRTLSQMCGRLYLPIFLLRIGLSTLMYNAFFMALATFCPSLPIILKFSMDVDIPKGQRSNNQTK